MAYGQTTVYGMKELRAYAEPEAGSIYKVGTAKVADGASLSGGVMVNVNASTGVVTPVILTAGGSASGTNKTPVMGDWADGKCAAPALDNDIAIINGGQATKVNVITGVTVRLGNMYQAKSITDVTAADFTDGSMSFEIDYAGKSYLNIVSCFVYVKKADLSATFSKGVDYNLTMAVNHVGGGDVFTAEISVIEGSSLETFLTDGTLQIDFSLAQSEVELTPGVDYTTEYVKTDAGKLDSHVHLIPPEGYDGIAASVRVAHKLSTFSGGIPSALSMYDTAATDARTISVYTGGVFKKSAVNDFQDFFNVTGFQFV